jgi:hypothetical protein
MNEITQNWPRSQSTFRFIDPLAAARLTGAKRSTNCWREGKCPHCGHKALKISRGDDGRTLLHCFTCGDFNAIVAALRAKGYTTTPERTPHAPKRRGPRFERRAMWDTSDAAWRASAAFEALTRVEIRIDAVISRVVPDEAGLRRITAREISELTRVPLSRVARALRVLKKVGRWVAVPFSFAHKGQVRRRHAYRQGGWPTRYVSFGGDPDGRDAVQWAKEDAKEARNHRVQTVGKHNPRSDLAIEHGLLT